MLNQFFTNNYDVLSFKPILSEDKMPAGLEELAKALISKGLLRIAAGDTYNFIIYPVLKGDKHLTFSEQELTDEKLLQKSKQILLNNLTPYEKKDAQKEVNYKINLMRQDIRKYLKIPMEQQMVIARLLVQSTHPVIMANLIVEGIYFFVTFGESIADLLDVNMWQKSRYSQGLQSNTFEEASIFVSSGGNPFFNPKESNYEFDGRKAISRLMTVAAQEIAHFADIIKDNEGNNLARFSSNRSISAPNEKCENARQLDLKNLDQIFRIIEKNDIKKLYNLERRYKIKLEYRKNYPDRFLLLFYLKISQKAFIKRVGHIGKSFVKKFKKKDFMASEILKFFGDMRFNLEPSSSAYTNKNKSKEKAVFCAEALARIPQQEVKWGKKLVSLISPNLQKYFYSTIIPEEYSFYKIQTGKEFELNTKRLRSKIFKKSK